MAELTELSELQKLIYPKRSLEGIAKLIIQTEKTHCWAILKKMLLVEFAITLIMLKYIHMYIKYY